MKEEKKVDFSKFNNDNLFDKTIEDRAKEYLNKNHYYTEGDPIFYSDALKVLAGFHKQELARIKSELRQEVIQEIKECVSDEEINNEFQGVPIIYNEGRRWGAKWLKNKLNNIK